MQPPSELQTAVERSKCGETQEYLHGRCTYNARRVFESVKLSGFDPEMVCGAYIRNNEQISSIKDAESHGIVHWWVVVEIDTIEWVIDLCSEDPQHYKETIIVSDLPDSYYELQRNPNVKPSLDVSIAEIT